MSIQMDIPIKVSLLMLLLTSCIFNSKKNYKANDIRIFKCTPAWELARSIKEGELDKAKAILSRDSTLIHVQDPEFQYTLAHWAAFSNKLPQFKFLLENGANVHARDHNGIDVTTRAANNRDTDAYLRCALEHGGDVNSYSTANTNIDLCTPLLSAIQIENMSSVRLLLDRGANVNLFWQNPIGQIETPISNSLENYDIAEYLLLSGKCDLSKPTYKLPLENMREIYIIEDIQRRLAWAKTKEDSLNLQKLTAIAQAQLDSLKR